MKKFDSLPNGAVYLYEEERTDKKRVRVYKHYLGDWLKETTEIKGGRLKITIEEMKRGKEKHKPDAN